VSERIELAALRPEDSDSLFAWINDRELVEWSAPFRPVDRDEHEAWFASALAGGDRLVRTIRLQPGDRLIGSCQLCNIDRADRSAELRIRVADPADRGRGHGTAAVRALLAIAFGELGLGLVRLEVRSDNAPAIAAYERAGFQAEGSRPQAATIGGRPVDLIVMSARPGDHAAP
jgi:RimJ/RimL family protein N-acetyltransferase